MANVKISALASATALDGAEEFVVVQASTSVKATADQVKAFVDKQVYEYNAPVAGASIGIADGTQALILNPAGTIATCTVQMPANPVDGDIVRVSTSQEITGLTVSPNTGQSIKNAPTTLAAAGSFAYLYRNSDTTWYRI